MHYSPPPLPIESASDHVTCDPILGGPVVAMVEDDSPKYCCCCFSFEIRETMMQALKRGWRSRRRPIACAKRWQGTFPVSL